MLDFGSMRFRYTPFVNPQTSAIDAFRNRYGPWALVAGASEGLGAAFAEQLAAKGLNIVLVARRPGPLDVLAQSLHDAHGVETRSLPMNLGRPDLFDAIESQTADLEIGLLVYNAAVSIIGPFFDAPLEKRMAELDVNCRGTLSLLYRFAPPMIQRGHGGIILMSSMAGFQGTPIVAHYAATKAHARILAEGLWDELREKGVDVLACAAGATRTPNFIATDPAANPAPVMEPGQAVTEALNALGHKPTLIPGRMNRLATILMTRLLPRALAIRIMGKSTRAMYPN